MNQDEYDLMTAVEDVHWWWCARREIIAAVIERYAPAPGQAPRKIIEVGCGTGGNLPMLAGFGEVLGAESESTAIAAIKDKHGDRFRVVQHTIPTPLPERHDVLGMFDVLEHIEDDAAALRWAAQQLVPGGIAVVTVPAFPALWTEHDEAAHHFRRYTPASLARAVPPELEVLHLTCFNAILFPPVALIRRLTRLLPKRYRPRGTNMKLPPRLLNSVLYRIFRVERRFVPRMRSPLGVSVMAVLRRRPDSA